MAQEVSDWIFAAQETFVFCQSFTAAAFCNTHDRTSICNVAPQQPMGYPPRLDIPGLNSLAMETRFGWSSTPGACQGLATVIPNPTDLDPRRFLNDDEDEEDCDHGGKQAGPAVLSMEKLLIDARTLLFSGPVNDRMLRDAPVRCLAMEQKDSKKPITVMINSPGGSADAGFAIYDLLRFIKPPVITVVNGLCASAGILIQLATDKKRRFCMPEARFMIHQPSTTSRGTASDLEITARETLKLRDRYNKIIAEASGRTADKVMEDARRDFWLDAGQALEYGLVAKVIKRRDELPES